MANESGWLWLELMRAAHALVEPRCHTNQTMHEQLFPPAAAKFSGCAALAKFLLASRAAGKKEGAEVGHRHRVGEQAGMSTSANQRLAGQVYMLWTYLLWTYHVDLMGLRGWRSA